MTEIWKDIYGYEGVYAVSNLGRVKRLAGSGNCIFDRLIKSRKKKAGYHIITLTKHGVCKTFHLHRLVAIAFIPNSDLNKEVNHIDLNKSNNIVENLEWVTHEENIKHFTIKGKRVYKHLLEGRPHSLWKEINQFDMNGLFIKKWESVSQASKALGAHKNNISACARKEIPSCAGFKWEYQEGNFLDASSI